MIKTFDPSIYLQHLAKTFDLFCYLRVGNIGFGRINLMKSCVEVSHESL